MELSQQYLDQLRFTGDQQADQLVQELFNNNLHKNLYDAVQHPLDSLDLFSSGVNSLDRFIQKEFEIPGWIDLQLLEEASSFYRKYAQEIMMLLGAVSLPYCYAAYPGNKVLFLSQKIRNNPGKRLLDTAAFVIYVCEPGAFALNGNGYKAVQQTRLIHAMVRFHLKDHQDWDPSHGIPVNMEDMAGTNLAFSYKSISSFEKIGILLTDREVEAYLHLWKWIGYLFGIPIDLLPDNSEQAALLEMIIRERNFKLSEEGIMLTRSLVDHYNEALPKGLGKLVESQMVLFLEKDISDILGLHTTPIRDIIVRSITGIQILKNKIVPVKPSYYKMKKEHERLKKMYA